MGGSMCIGSSSHRTPVVFIGDAKGAVADILTDAIQE
jgi:hypothetical protein